MAPSRREFLKCSLATGSLLLAGANAGAVEPVRIVSDDIRAASGRAELSMLFKGKTLEDARQWHAAFSKSLNKLLGDTTPPTKWNLVVEKETQLDDHTRLELVLAADGVFSVPVYVLVPKGAKAGDKLPGVVCIHGHGKYGHHPIVGRTDLEGVAQAIEGANYDYGLQFVRRGYVVAAPCMIPFGRRLKNEAYGKTDPCATTFVRLQALGQTTIAVNLRDLRWCLDLLQKRPEVNGENLGCAGLSYGGRMTMMLAAVDERIRVAAPSGAFNLLQERIQQRYSCGSQIVPGLLGFGDYSEIGSLIAPRPCVWEIGSRDGLVKPDWARVFQQRLERIYDAYGARENLHFDRFEGGHRWNGKVAFPLFDRVLRNA